ncbi:MAG: TonB-dependent receptor plug domain-containing protein, partial [Phascolarctobacterium sp.]
MLKMSSKALARAICLAVASVGFVANAYAADSAAAAEKDAIDTYHLAEVVVHGQRYIAGEFVRATSNVGILGEQDAMSSPISTTTLSEKAVGSFLSSTEGLSKVLSLVPSVVKTYDAAVDCITIRGFDDSGRGFMINGIPGMQAMTRQSSNFIDSIDVIEGPSTGITGSAVYNRDGGT